MKEAAISQIEKFYTTPIRQMYFTGHTARYFRFPIVSREETHRILSQELFIRGTRRGYSDHSQSGHFDGSRRQFYGRWQETR
jgi:hypothetical protein